MQNRWINREGRNVYIIHKRDQSSMNDLSHWYTYVEDVGVFQLFVDEITGLPVKQPRIMQPPSFYLLDKYYIPFFSCGWVGKTTLDRDTLESAYERVFQSKLQYSLMTDSCQEFAIDFAHFVCKGTFCVAFHAHLKTLWILGPILVLAYLYATDSN